MDLYPLRSLSNNMQTSLEGKLGKKEIILNITIKMILGDEQL